MTTINGGLTKAQYQELYRSSDSAVKGKTSLVDTADSILTQNYSTKDKIEQSISGRDAKDDGKISAGSKFCNFMKGIGNSIKGAIKGIFTPKGLLKTAAIVAACALGGPVVAGAIAAVGIIKGAVTIGKGAYAAHNATTDAEAELAWQNIGSGSFQVGVSAIALKGATGAIKAQTGATRLSGSAIKESLSKSAAGKAYAKLDGKTFGEKAGNLKDGAVSKYNSAKEGLDKMKDINKQYNEKISNAKDSQTISELNKARTDALKEQASESFKSYDKLSQKMEQIKKYDETMGRVKSMAKRKSETAQRQGKEFSEKDFIKEYKTKYQDKYFGDSKLYQARKNFKDSYNLAKEGDLSTYKSAKIAFEGTKTYDQLTSSGVPTSTYVTTPVAHLIDEEY